MATENFKIPVTNWTQVKIDNAKFILAEAKENLKFLDDQSSRISNRAFSILTILGPISGALIAFVVGQMMKEPLQTTFFTWYAITIIFCLIAIMLILGRLVMPRKFMSLGRPPKDICNDDMLGISLDKELSLIAIVMNEIENCQQKIEYNEIQNDERTILLRQSMKSLVLIFMLAIATLIFYFVFTLF